MLASILKPYFEDLAVDAPVLVDYIHDQTSYVIYDGFFEYAKPQSWFTYNNYFVGKEASNIASAQDCSIFRGSSQTVMASK
ncbi:hypothetical protein KC711_06120 [Candidatus Peregrinibacteria bacterium]|mgnify:CR=1 FL=1|nr:hypothetical protein [Candidatus Peregrinibacteria bacterium]